MRTSGRRYLHHQSRQAADNRAVEMDAIIYDVTPSTRTCRVKIQGSDTAVVCDYPEGREQSPFYLKPGQAVVKIGIRPPAQIRTVRVKDGWARPEHVARITESLAERTAYVVPVEQAVANHQRRRRELTQRVMGASTGSITGEGGEVEPAHAPKLKDKGWG